MKRLMWDLEWQKIKFASLNCPLHFFKRPTSDFYSKFYSELFRQYESYDALPSEWLAEKSQTAIEINKLLSEDLRILSVGSGVGFIEKTLVSLSPKISIDSYDFSDSASRWLTKVNGVNLLNSLDKNLKYDFIFCTQLLYALSDKEILEFAEFVKSKLKTNGRFLTVDTSLIKTENGGVGNKQSLSSLFKNLLRPTYLLIFKRKKAQFWGWQRDNAHLVKIFCKSDMILSRKFAAASQSFLIFEVK